MGDELESNRSTAVGRPEALTERVGDAPKMRSVFRAEDLVKTYGKRRVVNDVSISVSEGEIVGLLGPNGAGKTTTFYMMTGMIRPKEGKIFIDDRDVTGLPMYRRARLGIAYLCQEPSVFRKLTVEENIIAILETLPLKRQERRQRLEELLDELSIGHLAKSRAYNLSGGERRRVEITRALVTKPKFILLDEPFAGIDPIAVTDIQHIVADLKARGIGVLITDHNVHETLSITDRAYLMYEGRILKLGTSEFLANDPEARQLYLGEQFRLDR
jgi:lipopolysaccharide export system ATP-binding protein